MKKVHILSDLLFSLLGVNNVLLEAQLQLLSLRSDDGQDTSHAYLNEPTSNMICDCIRSDCSRRPAHGATCPTRHARAANSSSLNINCRNRSVFMSNVCSRTRKETAGFIQPRYQFPDKNTTKVEDTVHRLRASSCQLGLARLKRPLQRLPPRCGTNNPSTSAAVAGCNKNT